METSMSMYGSAIEQVVANELPLDESVRRLEEAGNFDELYELLALWTALQAAEGIADEKLISRRNALHKVTTREERLLSEMIRSQSVDEWTEYFREHEPECSRPGRQRRMACRLRDLGACPDLLLYAAVVPGVIPEVRQWIDASDITFGDVDRFLESDADNAGLWLAFKARIAWTQGHQREAKALLREALSAPIEAESWLIVETQAVLDGEPGYIL